MASLIPIAQTVKFDHQINVHHEKSSTDVKGCLKSARNNKYTRRDQPLIKPSYPMDKAPEGSDIDVNKSKEMKKISSRVPKEPESNVGTERIEQKEKEKEKDEPPKLNFY